MLITWHIRGSDDDKVTWLLIIDWIVLITSLSLYLPCIYFAIISIEKRKIPCRLIWKEHIDGILSTISFFMQADSYFRKSCLISGLDISWICKLLQQVRKLAAVKGRKLDGTIDGKPDEMWKWSCTCTSMVHGSSHQPTSCSMHTLRLTRSALN
jgi:hypothetical protein